MDQLALDICRRQDTDLICLYSAIDGRHFINDGDYQMVNHLINQRTSTRTKLTIMICSQGGDLVHTMKFLNLLRDHYETIEVYIPRIGKSSLTLLAMMSDTVYIRKTAKASDFSPIPTQTYHHQDISSLIAQMLLMINKGILKNCQKTEKSIATSTILTKYVFIPDASTHGQTITGEEFANDFADHGSIQVYNEESFGFAKLNSLDAKLLAVFESNPGVKKIVSLNGEFVND